MIDYPIDTSPERGLVVLQTLPLANLVVIKAAPRRTQLNRSEVAAAHGTLIDLFDVEGEGYVQIRAANGNVVYKVTKIAVLEDGLDCVRVAWKDSDGMVTPDLTGRLERGVSLAGVL